MTAATARTGAILFTDLVGFTEFTDAHGDRAALEVLDRQVSIASEVLGPGSDHRIVKELGDGLMLWFDSAADGLDAARGLLRSISEARNAGRFALSVRMGMHHGEVIERNDDYIGQTVNIASRVSELAGPNELLVSDQLIKALDPVPIAFRAIGPTRVRGVGQPIWLYRLTD